LTSHFDALARQISTVNHYGKMKMSTFKAFKALPIATSILLVTSVVAHAESSFDILESYYTLDTQLPLSLKTVEELTTATGMVADFSFDAFDNAEITARLEMSTDPQFTGKRPVVILLHGITQSLEQWWREDQGPYSFPAAHRAQLVENGFAVIAIDLRNHGARIEPHDFSNPYTYLENGYYEAARKMISQSVLDVRRTIDAVAEFEKLDSNRVAVVGFSLGAWTGYLSVAMDERIDAAVIIGMPFLPAAKDQTTSFISQFEYVEGLEEKPMLLVAGTEDHFYTREVVDALQSKMSTNTDVTWVDSGHDFPRSTATLTVNHLLSAF
jgi:dienelactone hydrolase